MTSLLLLHLNLLFQKLSKLEYFKGLAIDIHGKLCFDICCITMIFSISCIWYILSRKMQFDLRGNLKPNSLKSPTLLIQQLSEFKHTCFDTEICIDTSFRMEFVRSGPIWTNSFKYFQNILKTDRPTKILRVRKK